MKINLKKLKYKYETKFNKIKEHKKNKKINENNIAKK